MMYATDISLLDVFALLWFLLLWSGYVHYSKYRCVTYQQGLQAAMNKTRNQWALEVLQRDVRIMDSQILSGLVRKETFFASTTILILASSVALIGVSDEIINLFQDIPLAQQNPQILWELKVAVLVIIFIFAFFKFTWAIRQHSYCSILLGAIPEPEQKDSPKAQQMAKKLANLSNLAANHFNDGLRAYYFALAELSWFFHPVAFILATTWIVLVLYRREYHSKALAILS